MPFTKENGCVVYRPANYDKTKQYPTIILLHGQGERGDGTGDAIKPGGLDILLGFLTFQWNNIQAALDKSGNYVLVAPQLPTAYGYWPLEYVQKGVDYALNTMNANPRRLYLGWISLGGSGGWKYLSLYSSKFAAAFSICAVPGWSDAKELATIKCPVWAFHEAGDPIVGASATITAIDTINASNPPVKSTKTLYPAEGPMDHFIWGKVFDPTASPGVNGETVTLLGWLDLNQQGSPVAVPQVTVNKPADAGTTAPASPTSTLKAVPAVTNLTPTTATLDGSKSEGKITWQFWEMILPEPRTHANVFPNWEKGLPVININSLKPNTDYQFKYTVNGDGFHAAVVSFKTPATALPPIVTEKPIPFGATKVILREGNVIEFA